MGISIQEQNKAIVLEAFDTLFNRRHYEAAERYWSPNYVQSSAHIEPGREGLFNLVRNPPATLKYEPGLIVADDEWVIAHGPFSSHVWKRFSSIRFDRVPEPIRVKSKTLLTRFGTVAIVRLAWPFLAMLASDEIGDDAFHLMEEELDWHEWHGWARIQHRSQRFSGTAA
jgi:hypothetical protein